jgi:hypothetical protein
MLQGFQIAALSSNAFPSQYGSYSCPQIIFMIPFLRSVSVVTFKTNIVSCEEQKPLGETRFAACVFIHVFSYIGAIKILGKCSESIHWWKITKNKFISPYAKFLKLNKCRDIYTHISSNRFRKKNCVVFCKCPFFNFSFSLTHSFLFLYVGNYR